ncbi:MULTISPECIES: NAD(+) kinase [Testudinibacter]|uniref:NAD kinase n=1 Tax=Testudinibacter aquarius TaxID=1524974 RepID=A0A4R3Y6E6_9PAST|nr:MULTISPECIES: NAD(+) kinase [Testudinibacter]TNG95132.1 NAD(+) kinase [Pasteurellaceae bacterium USgator41]TNG96393.1 NAD(+) kinase [Pasteurellaceae bacterium UScroc12]TNG98059.1 NAD(+) kinase [Pasteurellaceae bacterium UScroc31]TNH03326.1 NAD(+) kinase [Pasteurellaceae bacterium USgator11]TNH08414.1 NAD(+) kinase [Pasteurellaceae bacterium Phil11]
MHNSFSSSANAPQRGKRNFHTIGLVGRPRNDNALQMHKNIYQWLSERHYQVLVEKDIGKDLSIPEEHIAPIEQIGEKADLAIVIGGDGNMLGTARILARYDIAVIGINRGHLGFLTDIDPKHAYSQLHSCLEEGEYFIEERFLLEAMVERDNELINLNNAVNEVVIHPAKIAHMIDFQVYIDDKFAFSQRSDGLIISTPTGSTAYSLSAGGPILTPQLNAIALVPMFPHTLSSRPLVIDGNSVISLRFAQYTVRQLEISCDSQVAHAFSPDDKIIVRKSQDTLRLLHLNDYNYFNVLSAKLGWLQKLF